MAGECHRRDARGTSGRCRVPIRRAPAPMVPKNLMIRANAVSGLAQSRPSFAAPARRRGRRGATRGLCRSMARPRRPPRGVGERTATAAGVFRTPRIRATFAWPRRQLARGNAPRCDGRLRPRQNNALATPAAPANRQPRDGLHACSRTGRRGRLRQRRSGVCCECGRSRRSRASFFC